MGNILDDRKTMLELDTNNGLRSIEEVGSQVKQVWEETRKLEFPKEYSKVKNVVVAGMGGSAYGTHVIQSVFKEELKIPVFLIPDYTLPQWVNSDTLVLLSSYSGNTEETLSAAQDAFKKKAHITALTSGGKLAAWCEEKHVPAYVYATTYNPCNVPRYALGYSIFGQIALLERMGILEFSQAQFQEIMEAVAQVHLRMSADVSQEKNEAKLLAFEVCNRIPVVVVAQHLEGPGHVVANCFNETSKSYSEYRVVPELNHHLMEGLQFPRSNEANLLFLLITSTLYQKENAKRMQLTAQVIEKNHCEYREISLQTKTKIAQTFELLLFGAYTSYYCAMLYGQNPTPNPWVDWFKAELKK